MEFKASKFGADISRRALLGTAAAFMLPASARAATSTGAVETVVGQGFAESEAARRTLEPRSDVFVGDLLGTGADSRLEVRLGAQTQVKLGAETRLKIDSFIWDAGGVLELQAGGMLFDGKLPQGSGVSVRSPFALIAVRGTRFFAGPSNGVFGVFVEQGIVSVEGGGRQVEVAEGMGTNIAEPGAAPTDPARWGEPRIRAALASVE
jgi:ferric-dicitrate binding protein FerR (iron transport regulator)